MPSNTDRKPLLAKAYAASALFLASAPWIACGDDATGMSTQDAGFSPPPIADSGSAPSEVMMTTDAADPADASPPTSTGRPITSDGSGFGGHWTILVRRPGDDDADSHTYELVEEAGSWLMKDCQWQPPCEPEPWQCEAPPPEAMASGSVAGDEITLEAGFERDGQVTRVHWELTHLGAGTLRGTVRTDGCAGECDWSVLACQIEAGLYPSCDEGGDFTGLRNCSCASPECG